MNKDSIAIYIHIPFCPTKCAYCDFNSYAMTGAIQDRTVDAIINEIRSSPYAGRPAKTVFCGGGTPTYLETEGLVRILQAALDAHPPIESCEITSEANPGTTDVAKFQAMREAGFNRISIGAQSFSPTDLRQLGRIHSSTDPARAINEARRAGFENINLDLMFALPGQSFRAWEINLTTALEFKVPHLSLYCLTIEPETRFYRQNLRGMLDLPDDESQRQMYDLALNLTAKAGLEQYEISNFARPGYACRHNLAYWNADEYVGYGPGAVGSVHTTDGRIRTTNLKHPEHYCQAIEQGRPPAFDVEHLSYKNLEFESLMLGLRLNSGVDLPGGSVDRQGEELALTRGWIKRHGNRIILTPEGRHFCSEVTLLLAPVD